MEAEGHRLAGGTSFVAAVADEALEPSTPFDDTPDGDIDGTAFMTAPFRDDPLPFVGEADAPPPMTDQAPSPDAGATAFVPAVEVTPSAPMSPEAYARLVYATYEQPADARTKALEAYGLDEARRAQLDLAMADYMRRHPEAFRVYMQWVQHLRGGGR